jgi:hypothetical protein
VNCERAHSLQPEVDQWAWISYRWTIRPQISHERAAISQRTEAALAAAKARGKRLGTPDPEGAVERMRVTRKAQAAQFAANVLPIIRDIRSAGHTSPNAIAGQLKARKVGTANGGHVASGGRF